MMKQIQEQTALNPLHSHWRLADDRNVLYLSPTGETDAEKTVELSPEQAGRIREITAITSSLLITLLIEKQVTAVHLVGRKINNREWAGSLATWPDTPAVAPTQAQELSFAEQIVSEANSVIAILDSRGKICRFNRLCEEYTGLKERDVIGQSVFKLFMSRREAVASRHYIENFFRNGNAYEIERWIKTRKGQRLFLFRNKFVHNGSGKNEIFLICAGTDITEERRAQERLRILANTDTVTGLPNRNAIHEFINHAIASAGESQVGIVYLDLDNFKKINDAYGHMFGDQLLQAVSLALLSCLEEDQVLASLRGEEERRLGSRPKPSNLKVGG
ncbi:cyclic di-GMP phosphodiesterase, partial [Salmonella enterica subsp. enterica serovar Wilhelmsburg]